ncbi:MAG: HigA family addiction module antidote protein [Alphaproteobacteria bacterium]|nr:HigA family addiction module antidote protein [Alphaproteobacteria bacterium]
MAIKRELVDFGGVDLKAIDSGRRIGPIHPGKILRREFLMPRAITPYRLAKDLHVPLTRIAAILAGRRTISAETALRLARYFGTSKAFWLNLQAAHDLEVASRKLGARVAAEVKPLAA